MNMGFGKVLHTLMTKASSMSLEQFRDSVKIGASTSSENFKRNLERRGIDVEELLEDSEVSSLDEVAAVQRIEDEIKLVTSRQLADQKAPN